jgi:hypothetical protein
LTVPTCTGCPGASTRSPQAPDAGVPEQRLPVLGLDMGAEPERSSGSLRCFGSINTGMNSPCHPASRCRTTTCPTCCWRYSGRTAAKILTATTGALFAVELAITDPTLIGLRAFRIEIRNWLDHRRRTAPAWKAVGFHLWLCRDRTLRGALSAGSLGPSEICSTLGARWPIRLRTIRPDDLRTELYAAIRPSMIAAPVPARGRYWRLRVSIWPRRKQTARAGSRPQNPIFGPMPMVLS